ncbi:hypothetical protein AJ78_04154 [Emergomyces pasteurianus Ep9510]|uniref:LEA domain-containing protein n=1 Tax=Emergomyces pasteurianus Ep9510 TaxID=1447872 RepID=A0A1J9PGP9_9EURO|nr:hypothetical protein AJ78_04154 [Emergomyces pasteurianus Ep9510]
MSFLARATPVMRTTVIPVRIASVAVVRPVCFSTSAQRAERGPIEATKETLKKADRVVSNAAVKGIETGEKATHKIKDTIGVKSRKVEGEAMKTAKGVGDKASELKDDAKARAEYLKEKTKEEAEETTGKA